MAGTLDHKVATDQKLNTLCRQYNPTQGRWMTPDPAGMAAADPANPQSWNRYAYVMNNPLNATDPFGLCYFGDGATIGVSGPRNPGLECGTDALDSSKPSAPQCSDDPGTNLPPCFTIKKDVYGNVSPVQLLKYDYALGLQLEAGTWRPTSTTPNVPNHVQRSVVQCANKIANSISIAGVIESGFDTGKHPYATWALDSVLGNTFAGLASIPEDIRTNPIKTYGDIVGGGLSQGIAPVGEALIRIGVPVVTSKGVFGAATEALLAGTPLGLGKLGFDALVYAGSAAYCYVH